MEELLVDPKVNKAYQFAKLSMAGKKRYSGEEFTTHCLKVAKILKQFNITDSTTLSVAILHHALSDGAATLQDIEQDFGSEIAEMLKTLDGLRVIRLTKLNQAEFAESLRKMFLSLAKDLRVVLIKLADIFDNLQTLDYLPREKQIEVSRETIEIFAPLAERLGMGEMKGQMQDLAFKNLHPKDYQRLQNLLKDSSQQRDKTMFKIKSEIQQTLEKEQIPCRIESRTKHLYSLFTKFQRPEVNFDINKIYDLIAFRIIVQTEEQCYQALDLVHKLWKPMPDYVRDYIAHPKPNGYQSIHTTVLGPGDQYFEVQIRTEKMHQDAEYGIAAHWNYAETKEQGASDEKLGQGVFADQERLAWVKSLSSWQQEVVDNEEFLKNVKTDFFGTRIFVFTPKGDIKDLPVGATPIDFAYSVHTVLGDRVTSAKVNGKLVPLDFKLKNSDVCELVISKDPTKKPNRDWLRFIVTSTARREIKKAYS